MLAFLLGTPRLPNTWNMPIYSTFFVIPDRATFAHAWLTLIRGHQDSIYYPHRSAYEDLRRDPISHLRSLGSAQRQVEASRSELRGVGKYRSVRAAVRF